MFHLHLLGSFFLFFLFFYRSTCFGSAWSFGLKDFLSQIYSIAFFSFLNSSERASIFPFNVECLLSIPTFDICSSLYVYVNTCTCMFFVQIEKKIVPFQRSSYESYWILKKQYNTARSWCRTREWCSRECFVYDVVTCIPSSYAVLLICYSIVNHMCIYFELDGVWQYFLFN